MIRPHLMIKFIFQLLYVIIWNTCLIIIYTCVNSFTYKFGLINVTTVIPNMSLQTKTIYSTYELRDIHKRRHADE